MSRKYFYPADFVDAKDGARIEVVIDLGFDIKIHEIIRIDGLWVPGIQSTNGSRQRAYDAKKLVETELQKAFEIHVHSTRREHDLFFGDILYRLKPNGKLKSIKKTLIKSGLGEMINACQ